MSSKPTLPAQIQQQIQKHYQSLIEFKKNQTKINFVLQLPETLQQQKQDLREMKQQIEIAMQQQQSALKQLQKTYDLYPMSQQLLAASCEGSLTKCFVSSQRKWKNAQILQVDVEQQVATVKRYGCEDEEKYPAYYLKVLKLPDPALFTEGAHCKAIYSEDGEFYPCVIEKIDQLGYHVRYKKYNAKEVVDLKRLRPMQNNNEKKEQVVFDNLNEFKVPENLKILPNDPDNVKKSKKNKLKALKFAYKNAKIEEVNQEKKSKWQQFNKQAPKAGHFRTKFDIEALDPVKRQKL